MALYYLDTSAAFKLLAAEEHAEAFLAFYREHRGDNWISSDLLRIEVSRVVARNWPALIPDAQRLLDAFEYVQIDEDVVRSAIVEPDRLLRSLDAVHLATARLLGPELSALLTYDGRLSKAAADAGHTRPRAVPDLNVPTLQVTTAPSTVSATPLSENCGWCGQRTWIESFLVVVRCPAEESVTFTVNRHVPALTGLPDIVPARESLSPAGNPPAASDHA